MFVVCPNAALAQRLGLTPPTMGDTAAQFNRLQQRVDELERQNAMLQNQLMQRSNDIMALQSQLSSYGHSQGGRSASPSNRTPGPSGAKIMQPVVEPLDEREMSGGGLFSTSAPACSLPLEHDDGPAVPCGEDNFGRQL